MSSSISSSEPRAYRRFATGLLVLVLLPCALLFAWGIRVGPFDGDLTRVGAHLESDYGWNGEQRVYPKVLYATGAYDKPYDVMVLGDSFSVAMSQFQWQNALVESTGYSVLTRNIYDTSVQALLETPTFRTHPPAWFVLEIVERQLPELLAQQASCDPAAAQTPRPPVPAVPDTRDRSKAERVAVTRVDQWSNWSQVRVVYVGRHLLYGVLRHFGREPSKAPVVELTRDDLFSSQRSNATLVTRADIDKTAQWDQATLDGLACLAHSVRAQVERNGHTRFVLMVAPDKLTSYAAYLKDTGLQQASRLPALAQRLPDLVPRLDLSLQQAAAAGTRDLYLPNNTHWGMAGHDVVAESLRQFLATPPATP